MFLFYSTFLKSVGVGKETLVGVSANAVCACGAQGKLCAVDSLSLGAKLRSAMLASKGTSFPLSVLMALKGVV